MVPPRASQRPQSIISRPRVSCSFSHGWLYHTTGSVCVSSVTYTFVITSLRARRWEGSPATRTFTETVSPGLISLSGVNALRSR